MVSSTFSFCVYDCKQRKGFKSICVTACICMGGCLSIIWEGLPLEESAWECGRCLLRTTWHLRLCSPDCLPGHLFFECNPREMSQPVRFPSVPLVHRMFARRDIQKVLGPDQEASTFKLNLLCLPFANDLRDNSWWLSSLFNWILTSINTGYCCRQSHISTFYRTQVNLGSDLWVRISVTE